MINMNLSYIDPGTGSMLFSIIIGATATSTATLFFLAKAVFIKIKLLFTAKKNGVVLDSNYHEYVIYNEGKQYWNFFKAVCEEFKKETAKLNI